MRSTATPKLFLPLVAAAFWAAGCASPGAVAPSPEPEPATAERELERLLAEVQELEEAFENTEEEPRNKEWVQKKLAYMVEVDQLVRSQFQRAHELGFEEEERERFLAGVVAELGEIDRRNTEALKEILARHGWPGVSAFGEEADGDAWLLVQHADQDLDFQREVLAILAELYPGGETNARNYAYLHDRVASAEGKPQRYGTQGRCTGPGEWQENPLEEPDRVDEIRAEVGLGPMAEYRARFVDICP